MGLLDIFKRKSKPADNAGFVDTPMGILYSPRWEDKSRNLPDPGAQAFAFETLALPAFTPIGPGNLALTMRSVPFGNGPPVMTQQGGIVTGVPTTAGGIYGQPLLNPLTPGPAPYSVSQDVPQLDGGLL